MPTKQSTDRRTFASVDATLQRRIDQATDTTRFGVRFVGFWLSVGLPVLYLPLLLDGLDGGTLPTFFGLFLANLLALVAGHNYAPE